jgi:hypothetical protein
MRATAAILLICLGAISSLPSAAQALATAYAADNPGGPTGPNSIGVPVPVTAQVGTLCQVIAGGQHSGAGVFGDDVDLGVIADANGHLLSNLSSSNASVRLTYQINCSGANNAVTLKATPLINGTGGAPANYAATVNYTAEADFAVVGGGASPFKLTQPSTSTTNSGNFGSGVSLANSDQDVTIKAYGFATPTNTTNDILVSGAYQGVITVTIAVGT